MDTPLVGFLSSTLRCSEANIFNARSLREERRLYSRNFIQVFSAYDFPVPFQPTFLPTGVVAYGIEAQVCLTWHNFFKYRGHLPLGRESGIFKSWLLHGGIHILYAISLFLSLSLSLSQRLFQRSSLRHSAFAFYFRFSTFSSLYFHRFLCIVVRFSRYGFSMHLHPAAFRCFCVSLAQLPPPSPLFRSIPVIPVPSRPLRRHISAPLFHSFARLLLLLLLSSLRRFALNVPLSLSLSLSLSFTGLLLHGASRIPRFFFNRRSDAAKERGIPSRLPETTRRIQVECLSPPFSVFDALLVETRLTIPMKGKSLL